MSHNGFKGINDAESLVVYSFVVQPNIRDALHPAPIQ